MASEETEFDHLQSISDQQQQGQQQQQQPQTPQQQNGQPNQQQDSASAGGRKSPFFLVSSPSELNLIFQLSHVCRGTICEESLCDVPRWQDEV